MKVSVSPEVLQWARETALTTVEEAARRIGKDADTIVSWEAGADRPTYPQLERLADAYGISINAFLLEERPQDAPPPDFRGGPHTGQSLSGSAARALRRANSIRELLQELHAAPAGQLPRLSAGASPETIGRAMRAHLGVDIAAQVAWRDDRAALREWRSAFERIGILVVQYRLAKDDYRGCSLRGNVANGAVIVLNERDAVTGRIFTLFHEFAHVVTGSVGAICDPLAWDPVAGGSSEERRMNAAAGQALVPSAHLAAQADLREIVHEADETRVLELLATLASRYKVSRQAMWYRLFESKSIDWQRFDALWTSLRAVSKPRSPDKHVPSAPRWERARRSYSTDVLQRLFSAEQSGRISTRSLVAAIDVPVEDLPRLEASVYR